jgi:hypothetical protein
MKNLKKDRMKKMREKEREVWIGENRLYLGEDDILYETIVGDIDGEIAIAMKEATFKLMNHVKGKLKVLIDINKAGKPSKKARNIFREFTEHEKWGRVAIFGLHPVAKMIASFGMGVSKKKDMRFFKTKEEALAWLKGEEVKNEKK